MDWPALFAYLCASTGWHWDEVGETMTLPRVSALFKHWRQFPPVHISVANALGTGTATPVAVEDAAAANDAEVEQFISAQPVLHMRRPT